MIVMDLVESGTLYGLPVFGDLTYEEKRRFRGGGAGPAPRFFAFYRDGVHALHSPIPFRLHRCHPGTIIVEMTGATAHRTDTCPCGATRTGDYWPGRAARKVMGRWRNRNSRPRGLRLL